jgi:hypothetical protein
LQGRKQPVSWRFRSTGTQHRWAKVNISFQEPQGVCREGAWSRDPMSCRDGKREAQAGENKA